MDEYSHSWVLDWWELCKSTLGKDICLSKNEGKFEIYLSSHIDSSCRSKEFLGNSLLQYWQWAGNSDTAFSTARFLEEDVLLISILQLGQVASSSRSLASARTWVKQPAHIKCPLVHCEHQFFTCFNLSQFNIKFEKKCFSKNHWFMLKVFISQSKSHLGNLTFDLACFILNQNDV